MTSLYRLGRARLANAWRLGVSAVLPYRPMDGRKEVLEAEYSSGVWGYLRGLDELSRFSVVARYCHYFKSSGSILELGCGVGVLQERLDRSKYSRYVGVDISSEAIRRAVDKQDDKTTFIAEDADIYCPAEPFDVIIFNECLEYFADPLGLVRRYELFLNTQGIYIVSIFAGIDTARSRHIWKMLDSIYAAEAETRVSNRSGYSWYIKVFAPPKCR